MKLEQALQTNKFKNERQKVSLNILYTAWWLKTKFSVLFKEYGLTHEQYNVMRILNGKHPEKMCVKDIAGRMIEKNSNVPRIIDRLDIKKLIKRNQGEMDGRQTMISLTEKGRTLLNDCTKQLDKMEISSLVLSNDEAKLLNELLEKLRTE
jgi:DNA-binding MarR family transcriptional regulator